MTDHTHTHESSQGQGSLHLLITAFTTSQTHNSGFSTSGYYILTQSCFSVTVYSIYLYIQNKDTDVQYIVLKVFDLSALCLLCPRRTRDKHPLLLPCTLHSDHSMNVPKAGTRTVCSGFLLFTICIIFPFPKANVFLKMQNTLPPNTQLPGIV